MTDENAERVRLTIRGAVQGVGFRPFVYRLASEMALAGWVSNSSAGVIVEAEGTSEALRRFLVRVEKEVPPRAVLQCFESSFLDPLGYRGFEIRESENAGEKTALILPDIATCADCAREIFDPTNRRFRYPFTNCTNCGPRFSIVEALPYDRANTSMKNFAMCANCQREYHDPRDRRFHAQPNACPVCGPQLQFWDSSGAAITDKDAALQMAGQEIRAGRVVALKSIGGFQLLVDARNEAAVVRLRQRKHREEKPFAVLFPDLAAAEANCELSDAEHRLLVSPESPIVLVRGKTKLAPAIAPGNPNIGAMLPYTPLHHLLMRDLQFPIVATSGNVSDEPICIDNDEARERLAGIADFFLVHDRPIVRHVDDSIVRVIAGREMLLRRARGFAPLPITLRNSGPTTLALGAHLKNTVALARGRDIFVSQHIGDLATPQAYRAFCAAAYDLPLLYDVEPEIIACDLHPDYLSTKYAGEVANRYSSVAIHQVQHHFAHVAACMAENELQAPALGVSWDGTGFGTDGTVWGGEFLLVKKDGDFERAAHLRTFALPGGEAAVKEPRRSALGLLYEISGAAVWNEPSVSDLFNSSEIKTLRSMLEKKVNSPRTSSAGRLFDAVAALLHVRTRTSFEGQAAMELEFAARQAVGDAYKLKLTRTTPIVLDWEPMIRTILEEVNDGEAVERIAARFHNALADGIVAVALAIGEEKIVLSGGCFQNRYLTERTIERLRRAKLRPYWHQRIPPNDGGIALGQVVAAAAQAHRS